MRSPTVPGDGGRSEFADSRSPQQPRNVRERDRAGGLREVFHRCPADSHSLPREVDHPATGCEPLVLRLLGAARCRPNPQRPGAREQTERCTGGNFRMRRIACFTSAKSAASPAATRPYRTTATCTNPHCDHCDDHGKVITASATSKAARAEHGEEFGQRLNEWITVGAGKS